jgi:succinate dehydrogenase/fumarate reductase flavoprotein subunit
VYFRGSGIAVDTNAESSVEALYAAGDCATVSGGIAGAAVLGHRLKSCSSASAAIDGRTVEGLRAQAAAHLKRRAGLPWKDFEDATRQTVTDYVGVRRREKGLKLALETLHALAKKEPQLQADDLHGLMRVHEAKNIRMNAEIMATASLARTETRTGSAHWRIDYPRPDETNWRKFVVVERGPEGPAVRTLPTDRPLSEAFCRSVETA